ncbi:acyltransferase family protein [Thalassobacillus pellis]|uniref:acyltransferase family protein n=1 Tax=Thalassobacillus pellis TaxID=748008 RepID=UPI00195FA8C9|nr:acyltransferase family protein [Thalassobacillus pellis]MBM7551844.1 fucose 4-O-acetylase-like acetyltransferase [Thalassobacillus pellis]
MKREAYFDNAKVFLIFLVVFGHIIQPFTDGSKPMYSLYMWVYTFHMPAFILLAGFFAKGSGDKGYIAKLAKKLIFPYLLFQFIYTIYYFFIGKEGWMTSPVYPHWSLWFLFSMFCWHVMLQLFAKIPPMLGMTISIALGIGVGYFDSIGHTFSLSRTFVFFPFFLAGYWLTKEQVAKWRTTAVKAGSLVVLIAVAGSLFLLPEMSSDWLLGSKSYEVMAMPVEGGLIRLGVYGIAALMTVSVLAWIPNTHTRMTSLGQRTLYVYLLHGFFIQFFRRADLFHVEGLLDVLGLAVVSSGIVYLLSSKTVLTLAEPLIEGKMPRLKKVFSLRTN